MELAFRDPRRTLRAGATTLLLLGVFGLALIILDGWSVRRGFRVTVYFSHLGGLQEGADVQVAGRVIGEVESISLVPARLAPAGHPLHPLGGVAVRVRIEERYRHRAPVNGEYFITAKGLVGERYVEIGPPPGEEAPRALQAGDRVRGVDPPHLDRVFLRTYRNLQIARTFARAVEPEAQALMDELSALAGTLASIEVDSRAGEALRAFAGEVRALRARWQEGQVSLADVERVVDEARVTAERVDRAVADVRARIDVLMVEVTALGSGIPDDVRERLQVALATAKEALAEVQRVTATAGEIAAAIEHGEGTVGALLFDPEFPEDAKNLGRQLKRQPWQLVGRPARE